ncbi:MAG: patatin-like phospholipase family protein [Tannerellaceae bacterium]|jgi:NTE family protein|nr:patatin-like phospholipase family protein [Tannerellaceae bacterium]
MEGKVEERGRRYRLGLALSGGGARGFAHLGVFKYMEERGIRPDIISGTSAGALAGALYADGYKSEEIQKLFMGRDLMGMIRMNLPTSGLFNMRGLKGFLERNMRSKRIEELEIPMVIVATDFDNGRSREFREGHVVEAVIASCSIPIIFSPVEIGGIHYVDGGLFRNFPVTNIRKECRKVIGVNVTPLVRMRYEQNLLHIAERAYHFLYRSNTMWDRELCDYLIETEEFDHYNMFDLKKGDRIVKTGYIEAKKVLEEVNMEKEEYE